LHYYRHIPFYQDDELPNGTNAGVPRCSSLGRVRPASYHRRRSRNSNRVRGAVTRFKKEET
jgi:hypothetical protein